MWRRVLRSKCAIGCLILGIVGGLEMFALAQDQTSAPPPPADAQTSVQQAPQATQVRAVRLSDVHGTVQVFQNGAIVFDQARLNMPVVQGMKFVTSDDGRAEIQFEDGSVARIAPNSSLTITKLDRNADGTTVTTMKADSGLTYYELDSAGGMYSVRFGDDSIAPNDGSIFRVDLDSAPELAVMHGSVHIGNSDGLSADIHTNQSARFDSASPNEYQLLESVTASSWDQWNSDRDEALAELDQNATEARADTGNPNNPAWSDLDAYGNWYNVPGYGLGWTPSGVGEDWDPYGYGYWGYYGGIGYTWISGYSWGWWPYRCGAWSWFQGFGWMWFPGNCGWAGAGFDGGGLGYGYGYGYGWYPYSVIWAIPVGYHCPHRPGVFHRPGHHRMPAQPMVAVDRNPKFKQLFRTVGVRTAQPRMFQYQGKSIAPIQHSIHPYGGGPLGEGFSNTMERANPGVMVRRAYKGVWYDPNAIGGGHLAYRPGQTQSPAPRMGGVLNPGRAPVYNPRPTSVYRPPSAPRSFGRPSGPPAPRAEPMRAPTPMMRPPAAHPAGHPHL